MSTNRRRFLGWLGGASLLGVAGTPSLAPAAVPRLGGTQGAPDEHAPAISETWDMSWTSRVTGKYKAVFDSPEISDGGALVRAVAWCDQYKEVYGTERGEMSPVLVLRHSAIDLVMKDSHWARFALGKENKLRDAKGKKWTMVNPVSAESAGDAPAAKKYKLETFIEAGGIVLACGWAFRFVSSRYRTADKLDAPAALARAKEEMIPGIILQPNGIFAALRAQEAGCAYIMAS
jgi:hypothetical protein